MSQVQKMNLSPELINELKAHCELTGENYEDVVDAIAQSLHHSDDDAVSGDSIVRRYLDGKCRIMEVLEDIAPKRWYYSYTQTEPYIKTRMNKTNFTEECGYKIIITSVFDLKANGNEEINPKRQYDYIKERIGHSIQLPLPGQLWLLQHDGALLRFFCLQSRKHADQDKIGGDPYKANYGMFDVTFFRTAVAMAFERVLPFMKFTWEVNQPGTGVAYKDEWVSDTLFNDRLLKISKAHETRKATQYIDKLRSAEAGSTYTATHTDFFSVISHNMMNVLATLKVTSQPEDLATGYLNVGQLSSYIDRGPALAEGLLKLLQADANIVSEYGNSYDPLLNFHETIQDAESFELSHWELMQIIDYMFPELRNYSPEYRNKLYHYREDCHYLKVRITTPKKGETNA